jgi:hypothetical protein
MIEFIGQMGQIMATQRQANLPKVSWVNSSTWRTLYGNRLWLELWLWDQIFYRRA